MLVPSAGTASPLIGKGALLNPTISVCPLLWLFAGHHEKPAGRRIPTTL